MSSPSRIPLLTFANAFGLTGLAEIWSTAVTYLHTPEVVAEVLWGVAVAAVVWLIVAHTRAGWALRSD